MEFIQSRRSDTERRLDRLRAALRELKPPIGEHGCVYLTGSFARGEATRHSDLDLFIVGEHEAAGAESVRKLSRLDEICIKADLIRTIERLSFPPFSGDGEYLTHYTIGQLVKTLGRPDDDASNTFTARLLLLLESRCLCGDSVYENSVREVVNAYWRDYEGHESEFEPTFLMNDILRLWRTFCVNYEARTRTDPPAEKAKRKLKNYKLRHSRLLTCFSALSFLLHEFVTSKTVPPDRVIDMVALSPTERIEHVRDGNRDTDGGRIADQLLDHYAQFLSEMDKNEDELIAVFQDRDRIRQLPDSAALGETMADLLGAIGAGSPLLRRMLV